ncbi:hypothetical protein GH714_003058 [Hevea brasiliensis]|uniref:VWFA domain-containing protein n=1 Tax=Hevea brasiliensis TaxID=3981 RepID=A0A6A6LEA1_HEVBR|nr:hypothetical protein GH714_003058 [Hevea brasiliensis]
MLEITGGDSSNERPGLDLVAVLDVSGSMKGEKIAKVKTAMLFVIKKLSPIDRLSVVTFSKDAARQLEQSLFPVFGRTSHPGCEDLKLTVTRIEDESTIEQVIAGRYPQSRDDAAGSVTVTFGGLYAKEVRKVIVDLLLPAVDQERAQMFSKLLTHIAFRENRLKPTLRSSLYAAPGKPQIKKKGQR